MVEMVSLIEEYGDLLARSLSGPGEADGGSVFFWSWCLVRESLVISHFYFPVATSQLVVIFDSAICIRVLSRCS